MTIVKNLSSLKLVTKPDIFPLTIYSWIKDGMIVILFLLDFQKMVCISIHKVLQAIHSLKKVIQYINVKSYVNCVKVINKDMKFEGIPCFICGKKIFVVAMFIS